MSKNKVPEILNEKPEPEIIIKSFHRAKLAMWSGFVNIEKIHGWASNRRIEIYRRKCIEEMGRPPNDEEICDFMLSEEEFHIRELGTSIYQNGIRIPLILDANGTLLDGNRRYVATKHVIKHNPDQKNELMNIPAWVLMEDASDDDIQRVLVECNFIDDWKIDWPNYIKAATVFEDYTDNRLNYDKLVERYGLKRSELRKMVKVTELIQEFLNYKGYSDRAIGKAYARYPLFEEAHNKFRAKLDSDVDFKEQFFDWMMEDKFRSYMQVRYLGEIRDNEEAWSAIHSDSAKAVETAIHIVQGEKLPGIADGEKKVQKIIKQLEKLTEQEIASIDRWTLMDLRLVLMQIVAMAEAAREAKKGKSAAKKEQSNESEDRATSG